MNKMKVIAVLIVLLTAFDALATSIGVTRGYIEEGNPIINAIISISPYITIKTVSLIAFLFTAALTYFVYKHSHKYGWVRLSMKVILALKAIIAMIHVFWIGVILF